MAAFTTLVLGGARSGKSVVAEDLAGRLGRSRSQDVWYLATAAPAAPGDADWAARIAAHRSRRPSTWTTIETASDGDLAGALLAAGGVALVDSLGTWVAAALERCTVALSEAAIGPEPVGGSDSPTGPPSPLDLSVAVGELVEALCRRRDQQLATVIVSEEVGLGVHPVSASGRQFRDLLGSVNQAVAKAADQVMLVVAGRVLPLVTVGEAFGGC